MIVIVASFTYSVEKCIWNVATPIDIQLSSLNNKSEFHSHTPKFTDHEVLFSFLAVVI